MRTTVLSPLSGLLQDVLDSDLEPSPERANLSFKGLAEKNSRAHKSGKCMNPRMQKSWNLVSARFKQKPLPLINIVTTNLMKSIEFYEFHLGG